MKLSDLKPGALVQYKDGLSLLVFKEKDKEIRWTGQHGWLLPQDLCFIVDVVEIPERNFAIKAYDIWLWSSNASGWRICSLLDIDVLFELVKKSPDK